MSKLDSIKEKLNTLEPGQRLHVHHMVLMDAVADDRREWLSKRSVFDKALDELPDAIVPVQKFDFGAWCKQNGYLWEQNPSSDSLEIIRK
jgi:hypothetical protein